jgi:hypothetical protein
MSSNHGLVESTTVDRHLNSPILHWVMSDRALNPNDDGEYLYSQVSTQSVSWTYAALRALKEAASSR